MPTCKSLASFYSQARALNARLRPSGAQLAAGSKKEFVHMLNCTLTATQRTLCCILENHQTPTGIRYCLRVLVRELAHLTPSGGFHDHRNFHAIPQYCSKLNGAKSFSASVPPYLRRVPKVLQPFMPEALHFLPFR